jgi:hypothetical protein
LVFALKLIEHKLHLQTNNSKKKKKNKEEERKKEKKENLDNVRSPKN